MATDRVTVRIAEAAILRLEEVLTRSDRPLNPQTRATMVEEVLTLSARIFDQDDEFSSRPAPTWRPSGTKWSRLRTSRPSRMRDRLFRISSTNK